MTAQADKNATSSVNMLNNDRDRISIMLTLNDNCKKSVISTEENSRPYDTNNVIKIKSKKINNEGIKLSFSKEKALNQDKADINDSKNKVADYTIDNISEIENEKEKKNKTDNIRYQKRMTKNTCFDNLDSLNESFSSFISEKINFKQKSNRIDISVNKEVYRLPLAYKEKANTNSKDEKEPKITVNLTLYDKKKSKSIVVNCKNDLGLNFFESQLENSTNYVYRYNDCANNYKLNKNDRNISVVKKVKRERN